MSHSNKHRRKEEDLKHSSKSNVFERLGDSRSERKQDKYYKSTHDKFEEHSPKHDHIKKKTKLKSALKHSTSKSKGRKDEYVDEPVRPSSKLHRTYDEQDVDFTVEPQHHGRTKQEASRGHKRKVARSNSTASSSVSPPRQAKHLTKRQRYQSPSPEPSYHPKGQERGRSRERRGKKQFDSPDESHQQSTKMLKYPHSHHSVAKKLVARETSPEDTWSQEGDNRHKTFTSEKKKTRHHRDERYEDDSFSKSSKHLSRADISEQSYVHDDHHREKTLLYNKKHKQLKKEKVVYSSEENMEGDSHLQRRHKRSPEITEKRRNKKIIDQRDDRSTSSHYAEFSSTEQSAKMYSSKKKRKDIQPRSPSPSPPRSITPTYHSKKSTARYSKHLQAGSNDDLSDVEEKLRAKVKKKKKHRMNSDADDIVESQPPPIRKQRYIEEDITDDGRTKKTKKRKRNRDIESASVSRSESEDRLPKKQRISERETEDIWKDRRKERKMEEKIPILRRSPARRTPTPPHLREKVLPRRRVETPESSSSRSTSRHHKLSPGPRNVAVLQRRTDRSLERDSFKLRPDERRGRREEPVYVRDADVECRKPLKGSRMEDRRIRVEERSRERPISERSVYSEKSEGYTQKQQKLSYEEKLLLLKEHLNAEKRRPSHRAVPEFAKHKRPTVQLERRIDPPPVRRDRAKSDWKAPPVLERSTKRSDVRERKPLPIETVQRVREIRNPSTFEEPSRPRRVSPWVEGASKPSSVSRHRNVSKERWPPARRPIDDLIGDVRYKDGKGQSISRDRGQFRNEGKSPAPSGTYREVRRSGDHHSNRDLRLEVTIHDGGNRTNVDFEKMKSRKPRSPARMVAYDPPRSHDRSLHPPPPPVVQRSRSGSNPKRPETSRHQRDRSDSYHQQRAPVGSTRNASRDRPRSRDYQVKRDGQNSSFRGDATKLTRRDKLHPPALNRDRSRVSTTSRSSTRSPRRMRRHSPLAPRSGRTDRQSSRGAKSERGETKHSSDRQKRSKEKRDETSSTLANQEKETTTEAADVLEVDWKGLTPVEKEKGTEEGSSGSVLSRFTPGNVLLRMGISSKLLPEYLVQRVAQKCSEVKSSDAPPLVLEHGLGALNRGESMRRSSWLNNFSNLSPGTRMTSFTDASYRQRLLGIKGDMRIPTFPPQIINARTYSASIKHYLNKTANKIPIEVQ
uniref:Serine/arginine repetitive matrix protein 1-like n=1 Tax=Phallusia mammillata TaxID=59560 RepID=A0A6F9DU94_9ASCI|nr:serine/arginine repetitive matrix protein 1-like [Phallusia mammillata]